MISRFANVLRLIVALSRDHRMVCSRESICSAAAGGHQLESLLCHDVTCLDIFCVIEHIEITTDYFWNESITFSSLRLLFVTGRPYFRWSVYVLVEVMGLRQ